MHLQPTPLKETGSGGSPGQKIEGRVDASVLSQTTYLFCSTSQDAFRKAFSRNPLGRITKHAHAETAF